MSTFYNNGIQQQNNKVVISGPDSGSIDAVSLQSSRDPNLQSGSVVVEKQNVQRASVLSPIGANNSAPIDATSNMGTYALDLNVNFKTDTTPLVSTNLKNNTCFSDFTAIDPEQVYTSLNPVYKQTETKTAAIAENANFTSSTPRSSTTAGNVNYAGGGISTGSTPASPTLTRVRAPTNTKAWYAFSGDSPYCNQGCQYIDQAQWGSLNCSVKGPFRSQSECLIALTSRVGASFVPKTPPSRAHGKYNHVALLKRVADPLGNIAPVVNVGPESTDMVVVSTTQDLGPGALIKSINKTRDDIPASFADLWDYVIEPDSYKYCWEVEVDTRYNSGVTNNVHYCRTLREQYLAPNPFKNTPEPLMVGGPYLACDARCLPGSYVDGSTTHHHMTFAEDFPPVPDGIYKIEAYEKPKLNNWLDPIMKNYNYRYSVAAWNVWSWPIIEEKKIVFIAVLNGRIRWKWEPTEYRGQDTPYAWYGDYQVQTPPDDRMKWYGGSCQTGIIKETVLASLMYHLAGYQGGQPVNQIIKNPDKKYISDTYEEATYASKFPNKYSHFSALTIKQLMNIMNWIPTNHNGKVMDPSDISISYYFPQFLKAMDLLNPAYMVTGRKYQQNNPITFNYAYQTIYKFRSILEDSTGALPTTITNFWDQYFYDTPVQSRFNAGGNEVEIYTTTSVTRSTSHAGPTVTIDEYDACWPYVFVDTAGCHKCVEDIVIKILGQGGRLMGPLPVPLRIPPPALVRPGQPPPPRKEPLCRRYV